MSGSPLVVDASVVASLLFDEPTAERVESALELHSLLAPSLLPYEVANVALRKLEVYPDQAAGIRNAVHLLDLFAVEYVQIPPTAMVKVAEATGLSSYDSAYLWLSKELRLPLATLDRTLESAARTAGVRTLSLR